MGIYFHIGICTSVTIARRGDESADFLQRCTKTMADGLDLALYDLHTDNESVCWELRPRFLEEGLLEFLQAQFALYPMRRSPDALFERIREAHCAEDILALAKTEDFTNFCEISWDNCFLLRLPRPQWKLISLFHGGKIHCETGFDFFAYLEHLLHTMKVRYPLAGTMKVFVDG